MVSSLAMILIIILSMQSCKTSLGNEVIYKDYEVQKGSSMGVMASVGVFTKVIANTVELG